MKKTNSKFLIVGFLVGLGLPAVAHAGRYNGQTCTGYPACSQLVADCIAGGDVFHPTSYNPSGGIDGGCCGTCP